MASAEEHHDPVTRFRDLKQVGADEEIAVLPRRNEIGAWLIRARSNAKELPVERVVSLNAIRLI